MQARQPRQVSMSGTPDTYRPSLQSVSHNDGVFTTILLIKVQIKNALVGAFQSLFPAVVSGHCVD